MGSPRISIEVQFSKILPNLVTSIFVFRHIASHLETECSDILTLNCFVYPLSFYSSVRFFSSAFFFFFYFGTHSCLSPWALPPLPSASPSPMAPPSHHQDTAIGVCLLSWSHIQKLLSFSRKNIHLLCFLLLLDFLKLPWNHFCHFLQRVSLGPAHTTGQESISRTHAG